MFVSRARNLLTLAGDSSTSEAIHTHINVAHRGRKHPETCARINCEWNRSNTIKQELKKDKPPSIYNIQEPQNSIRIGVCVFVRERAQCVLCGSKQDIELNRW